jgi:hypothetical protein
MIAKEFGAMSALRASNDSENPAPSRKLKLFASAWFVGTLSLAALPAYAASHDVDRATAQPAREKVTALASQDPETTSSIRTGASEDLNCARSRKRLFVEGEGWIVRRVTTCY